MLQRSGMTEARPYDVKENIRESTSSERRREKERARNEKDTRSKKTIRKLGQGNTRMLFDVLSQFKRRQGKKALTKRQQPCHLPYPTGETALLLMRTVGTNVTLGGSNHTICVERKQSKW